MSYYIFRIFLFHFLFLQVTAGIWCLVAILRVFCYKCMPASCKNRLCVCVHECGACSGSCRRKLILLALFFSPTPPSQMRSWSMHHFIQHYSINTSRREQRGPANALRVGCRTVGWERESRRHLRMKEERCRYKEEMTCVERDQEMWRVRDIQNETLVFSLLH